MFGVESFPVELISTVVSSINSILTPKFLKIFRVEWGSCPVEKLRIMDFPLANYVKIIALWDIDLSAGIVRVPFRLLKFCLTTFFIARY